MGSVATIRHNRWPKQGSFLGKRVTVCYHYDTEHLSHGTIVRDDAEEPHVMAIKLDDGRIVLSTECMYQPESEA